jgi:hypothetical protein
MIHALPSEGGEGLMYVALDLRRQRCVPGGKLIDFPEKERLKFRFAFCPWRYVYGHLYDLSPPQGEKKKDPWFSHPHEHTGGKDGNQKKKGEGEKTADGIGAHTCGARSAYSLHTGIQILHFAPAPILLPIHPFMFRVQPGSDYEVRRPEGGGPLPEEDREVPPFSSRRLRSCEVM